jgi:hypothetical protein
MINTFLEAGVVGKGTNGRSSERWRWGEYLLIISDIQRGYFFSSGKKETSLGFKLLRKETSGLAY